MFFFGSFDRFRPARGTSSRLLAIFLAAKLLRSPLQVVKSKRLGRWSSKIGLTPPQKPTYPLQMDGWKTKLSENKKWYRVPFQGHVKFPRRGGVDNLILNWNTGHLKTLHPLLPTTNGPEGFVDRTWMSIQESNEEWKGLSDMHGNAARHCEKPKKVFGWGPSCPQVTVEIEG